jgi:hypothetical protein
MSSGGPAASTSGWFIRPRVEGTGSTGCAGRCQGSLLIGRYVMATAGHREPCDTRGSCTVLGAPEGEIPSGDSTLPEVSTSYIRIAIRGQGGSKQLLLHVAGSGRAVSAHVRLTGGSNILTRSLTNAYATCGVPVRLALAHAFLRLRSRTSCAVQTNTMETP